MKKTIIIICSLFIALPIAAQVMSIDSVKHKTVQPRKIALSADQVRHNDSVRLKLDTIEKKMLKLRFDIDSMQRTRKRRNVLLLDSLKRIDSSNYKTSYDVYKNNDSFLITKRDSLYKVMRKLNTVSDSLSRLQNKQSLYQLDSLRTQMNKLRAVKNRSYDSLSSQLFQSYQSKYKTYNDSTRIWYDVQNQKWDSARKLYGQQLRMVNALRKKVGLSRQQYELFRSLPRMKAILTDTLTLNKRILAVHRYDSLKKLQYVLMIRQDSLRLKTLLLQKKALQLQRLQRDTLKPLKKLKTRMVTLSVPCPDGTPVVIRNYYREVIVKTIAGQKCNLNLAAEDDIPGLNDARVLENNGVEVAIAKNSIAINSNGKKSVDGRLLGSPCAALTVEIPENARLQIQNHFAKSTVENPIVQLKADLDNGDLLIKNADSLFITSRYSTISAGDIKLATIDLSGSHFKAGNIDTLSITSDASTFKADGCVAMQLKSSNDKFMVDNVVRVSGNKKFGMLTINQLKEQLILTGVNADMQINSITSNAPLISINNKFADMQLPVYTLPNYSIRYAGSYTDVDKATAAYAQTSNTKTAAGLTQAVSKQPGGIANGNQSSKINASVFEAKAGDINKKYTKVDIDCQFCSVRFQ
ncbi:MAG: hypothetical protein JST86_15230 [Bacteroidetes bacterium]|nr:hypothetical protein [Bacteroidota bacterium]